eukprot:scaffold34141_cov15-Tisochrysis_lutea.AAC.1
MDLGVLLPAVAANEAAVTANDAATANEAGIEEISWCSGFGKKRKLPSLSVGWRESCQQCCQALAAQMEGRQVNEQGLRSKPENSATEDQGWWLVKPQALLLLFLLEFLFMRVRKEGKRIHTAVAAYKGSLAGAKFL